MNLKRMGQIKQGEHKMIIKCKMCGGDLRIEEGTTVAECEYCGTKQTVPNADNEKKIKLFERANRLRAACEFDKAAGVYESIVADFDTEAEAYWGLILCKFGIEYVDDPATGDKVPTCHRSSFDSVLEDPNFELVMENSDAVSRKVYRDEAKAIEELRRSIIEVSSKEEPYDVFISYKELDASGERTIDSVIAQDIYKELTNEGYRVFFSRISLESKLGVEYEPYIFAALNSARVMIVVGTDYDNFNAVWVKNEWSRYLALIASGQKKTLIPCFKNIDAYDMPREFNKLAAQDMGKVGAMQDLLRGVEKLLGKNEGNAAAHSDSKSAAEPLLTRAFMFLEDGNWKEADKYCEKVLDQDPENAQAYLGKLMAECCVRRKEELKDCRESFDDSSNFKKVVRFGDKQLVDELESYSDHIYERNENDRLTRIYRGAVINMKDANTEEKFKAAAKKFESIHGFMDADEKCRQCLEKAEESRKDAIYHAAIKDMERDARLKYGEAISKLESIRGWRDADKKIQECSDRLAEIERKREEQRIADEKADKERRIAAQKAAEKRAEKRKRILSIAVLAVIAAITLVLVLTKVIIPNSKYNAAVELMDSGKYAEAIVAFEEINGYKDSAKKIDECEYQVADSLYQKALSFYENGEYKNAAIAFGGAGDYKDARERSFALWNDIAERQTIACSDRHTVGLKSDGTVVAVGDNDYGRGDVSDWTDVVAIACSVWNTVGLKSDGTVVAAGDNGDGRCEVSDWTDVVAIACGYRHTVGLKSDGTVVAVGGNYYGQCDVSDWTNIKLPNSKK